MNYVLALFFDYDTIFKNRKGIFFVSRNNIIRLTLAILGSIGLLATGIYAHVIDRWDIVIAYSLGFVSGAISYGIVDD